MRNFENKVGKVQQEACLTVTGVIKGISTEKLYD